MAFNKKLALNIVLCVIIVVAFILNMVLLCTDVFNGTYSATLQNGENVAVKFYDNTFTYIEEKNGKYETYSVGFYKYFDANKNKSTSSEDTEDRIFLILSSDDNYFQKYMTFQRKSVFCISDQIYYDGNSQDVSFYCTMAILLQVLYIILEILAIIILIIYNKRNRRTTENVKSSSNV